MLCGITNLLTVTLQSQLVEDPHLIDRIEAGLTLFLGDPNVCEWNRQHSSQTLGPCRVLLKLLAPGLEIAPIEITSKSNRFSASVWLCFFKVLLDSLVAVSEEGYAEYHAGKPSAKGRIPARGERSAAGILIVCY